MTVRRAALVLLLAAVACLSPFAPGPSAVHATCGTPDQDVSDLFSVSPPAPNLTLQGEAPFQVAITFVDKTVLSGPLTMSLTWGDGATSQVTIISCGDDVYSFPAQQLSHTFTSPGTYPVQWHLNSPYIGQIDSLAVIVTVTAAATQAPATPTVVPTATSQAAAPTSAPATPAAPTAAAAADVPTATPVAETSATPSPTPTLPPTNTPTATPTAQPTAVPAVAAAVVTPSPSPPKPEVPRVLLEVPDPVDVSTDAGVVSTNLALAGVSVWVFFSSVLFNQTMQEHRDEISGWTKRLRPRVKYPRQVTTTGSQFNDIAIWAGVLGGTGIVYGLLEPGFGFNRASFVLFASVVIGVGIVGTFFSSLEAWSRRRRLRVKAAVRAYTISQVVAAVCVAASRLLGLHPGVIYGFAASCVVLDASSRSDDPEGRALIVPLTACLGLSVICWLALGILRSLPGALLSDILEGVAIIVFVGGLEGLFVNLIPLQVMDGAKIYRWNRRVWIALVLVTAFLVWHVLLNSQGAYFESLRKASSLSVLIAFLIYTAAGVGLWGYFELRGRKQRPVSASGA
jgi:hypothetical protein